MQFPAPECPNTCKPSTLDEAYEHAFDTQDILEAFRALHDPTFGYYVKLCEREEAEYSVESWVLEVQHYPEDAGVRASLRRALLRLERLNKAWDDHMAALRARPEFQLLLDHGETELDIVNAL